MQTNLDFVNLLAVVFVWCVIAVDSLFIAGLEVNYIEVWNE